MHWLFENHNSRKHLKENVDIVANIAIKPLIATPSGPKYLQQFR